MSARSVHPFPARMAPHLALDYLPELEGTRPLRILDPMCGSGTVLAAAVSRGHEAIGLDIDPLAVLMSQVATSHWNGAGLCGVAVDLVNQAKLRSGTVAPWDRDDARTHDFAKFWFGAAQLRQLMPLSKSIAEVPEGAMRDALQIALSRIIITKTPKASLASDTSHSRPHRTVAESDFDVWEGFVRSAKQLEAILGARIVSGKATVRRGDSRMMPGIPGSTIDLGITSPPYLNALDYLRGHKMSLIWFGYSIDTLREIRAGSIGAERALGETPSARVVELRDHAVSDAGQNPRLPLSTITRYAFDMARFADEMARVMKSGARLVVVVGNSHIKGSPISNDGLTSLALEQSGFTLDSRVERDIPPNSRYLPIGRKDAGDSMEKRMRSEIVLSLTAA